MYLAIVHFDDCFMTLKYKVLKIALCNKVLF